MPKFSIIIPVYKVEKYVRDCLDSVLAQEVRTSETAHEFAVKWPETFRVIDKYGSCVSGGALPISTGEAFDRAVRELLPDVHAAIEDNTIGRGAPFHFVREWRKDYSRNTWRFKVFRLQGNFSQ